MNSAERASFDWPAGPTLRSLCVALFLLLAGMSSLMAGPAVALAQGDACPLPADLDGSGLVDAQDIALVAGHWQQPVDDPRFDLDDDGDVDVVDTMLVAADWGKSGPTVPRLPGDGLVWAAGSTRKIRPTDPVPATTWVWGGCRIRLHAARNETEPVQVVVTAGAQPLTGANAVVSDLTNGSGASIGQSQIALYREAYYNVLQSSDPYGEGLPAGALAPGLIPDALIPFYDPYNAGHAVDVPFDVPAGQNQPIWIDVTVPAGTPAGTYRGTITVTTDQGSLVLPLELKVWSFTLPAQPTLSINFTLDPAWTLPPQYDVSQGTPAFYDLVDKHYEALVAHRLSPMNLYRAPAVSETSGQVQLDWSQADPLYAHWLDAHDLPAFYIPDVYDGDNDRYRIRGDNSHYYTQAAFGDPTFVAKAKQYYAAVRDHLVNRGWWDQAWTYPTDETEWVADEPLNNGLDGYQRLAAWAQLLKDPDLDYRIMASSVYPIPVGPSDPDHGWPDLKGLVDDWNVVVQDADRDPELWESRQALGETLSFYHNDWGDFLDYKATLHRGLGWVAYKYGAWAVTGWAVAAWIGSADSIVNPWQSAVTPVYGYGGGALFWPGHAIEGDANKNVDGPLPSIRLKLAREAVEDHDYLTSLAAQTSPEYARALVRGLIPRDYRDWDPSPEAIYALRDRIGRLLDSGASIPLATIHGQVTDEATTQPIPGVFVTDGASGALADAAGQYTLTVTVPASGSVTLNFSAPRYQPATHSVIVSVPAQSAGRSLTASQASTPPSHPAQKGVGPTLRSPIGQIQAAGLGKLSPEVHLRANPAGGISAPRYQPATQSVTVSVPAQTAGRSLTASQASTPPSRPAQKGAGQIQAAGLGKLSPEVHLRANSASDQATLDATLTRVVEESLLLYSFETDAEVNEWEFANTQSVARATSRVTAGAYALRVVFGDGVGQGEPYAGVGTFPTRDWSGYTALEFDVYNESDYYTDLDVYIVDAVGGEYPRTGGTITLLPNRSRHVVIPMQEVAASGVDLTSIDWLDIDPTTMIQVENYKGQRVKRWPAGPRTLYFDNLRLVRVVVE